MRGFILLNFRTAKFSTRELRVSVPFRGFMLDNLIKLNSDYKMALRVSVSLRGFMLDNRAAECEYGIYPLVSVPFRGFMLDNAIDWVLSQPWDRFPSPCGVSC